MNKERLLKLALHLETGTLGHSRFDFGHLNLGPYDYKGCGTAGCALGECPIAFPDDWTFKPTYLYGSMIPVLSSKNDVSEKESFCSAELFFEISCEQAWHLFYPTVQKPVTFGGKFLNRSSTREDVAKQIRSFVEKMACVPLDQ